MAIQPITKQNLRTLLRYEFEKGLTADQATQNICQTYGEDIVNRRTAFRWFALMIFAEKCLQPIFIELYRSF